MCPPCQIRSLLWLLGLGFFFASGIYAVAEIPFPRSTTGPPPDYYLDFAFLARESELNEMIYSVNKTVDSVRNAGITPFLKYWGDLLGNPVGGNNQTADWYQLLIFGGKFDLERLMRWKGGEFTISASDTAGNNLQGSIGSIFTPSQAVVLHGFALYLLFINQRLFEDRIECKFGRMSAGSLFASLPGMSLPVSGAVNGNPAALFYNAVGFRAASKATWATAIKVKPTFETYLQVGGFQVNPRINNPSYHGVDFSIRRGDGVLCMAEIGWSPTFYKEEGQLLESKQANSPLIVIPPFPGLPGLYEFGAYIQNYPMPTFIGNETVQNVYGFYWQAQQMLWRSRINMNHHFSIWSGITCAPQAQVALMPVMAYGGLAFSGLIPNRDKDQLLLNYYIAGFSHFYSQSRQLRGQGRSNFETSLELSYIVQLTRQIQFQPDLQWFIQPGGCKSIPNALVIGFQISFVW